MITSYENDFKLKINYFFEERGTFEEKIFDGTFNLYKKSVRNTLLK
jgi:hypothetical protein